MGSFINKDLAKLLKRMATMGVSIEERSGRNHNKFFVTLPNGKSFVWTCSKTPSDYRSPLNEVARLRRQMKEAGFDETQANQLKF